MSKFHRYDNSVHAYPASSAWLPDIAPDGDLSATPIVFDSANGVTVIFSNLEELLNAVVDVSRKKGVQVGVLNINAHGLPGGTWFPKDEKQKKSGECASLRKLGSAPDKESYKLYYTMPSREQVMALHKLAVMRGGVSCVTDAPAWREVVARVPGVQGLFSDNAVVRFESCLVGLGPAGEDFGKSLARLLLTGKDARVESSVNLGLADWSMPEGMGFWDYQDEYQLQRDAEKYDRTRKDRDVMQKGTIRVTSGAGATQLIKDQYFMATGKGPVGSALVSQAPPRAEPSSPTVKPASYRASSRHEPNIYSYMLGDLGSSSEEPAPESPNLIKL